CLARAGMADEAAGAADAGQRDRAGRAAVEREDARLALRVAQILQHEPLADDRRARQRRLVLADDLAQLEIRQRYVGRDDPLARRVLVGAPVKDGAAIAEIGPVILHAGDQRARRGVGTGEIDERYIVARVGP